MKPATSIRGTQQADIETISNTALSKIFLMRASEPHRTIFLLSNLISRRTNNNIYRGMQPDTRAQDMHSKTKNVFSTGFVLRQILVGAIFRIDSQNNFHD